MLLWYVRVSYLEIWPVAAARAFNLVCYLQLSVPLCRLSALSLVVSVAVCLSAFVYVCLSVCLTLDGLYVSLSFIQPVSHAVFLFYSPPVCLSSPLSLYPSACLSLILSVCLSVCQCVHFICPATFLQFYNLIADFWDAH